ncbi:MULTISPECIES: hypothetical protein [Lacticaseibacillus]|uniref:Lipoprotein n=5 Tax=Lacticaseibacillus TaxID=2759736 RepID=A0AAN1KF34_LACCA|nr:MULTISPECIES: hypothetical protein [Lacticaseibacillus]ARY92394.1 hypothetical protein BGL52_11740 [Lacticaseibacillus casei]KAB1971439.1 hypothetical protein F9B82_02855 [Lacticaseibacillus casei]MBI6597478.1 hypothetical protein [Lacticaseibacillus casei]MBO1481150.1 hypothetical protein [Lacticaseibacillus casei]MBO2416454.1 hypothetical protein [Lacticaseibacillus casei]
MRKLMSLLVLMVTIVGIAGCQSKSSDSSAKKSSTMVTTNKFDQKALQKRYTKISDTVIQTLTKITVKDDQKDIMASAKKGVDDLDKITLELQNNQPASGIGTKNTNGDLTKALITYSQTATDALKSLQGNDSNAFQSDVKNFFSQAASIGKQYFNGQLPVSIQNFSQNRQAVTTIPSK